MVDTNSDPREVDFVIPSNDDASKSIEKIMTSVSNAVIEGLSSRKNGKDKSEKEAATAPEATPAAEATPAPKAKTARKRVAAVDIKEASSEEE